MYVFLFVSKVCLCKSKHHCKKTSGTKEPKSVCESEHLLFSKEEGTVKKKMYIAVTGLVDFRSDFYFSVSNYEACLFQGMTMISKLQS